MMFVDQIEEVSPDLILVKGEQSIVLKKKGDQERDGRVVLTSSVSSPRPRPLHLLTLHASQDEIALKEWLLALTSTHKNSVELLGSMAKATKIIGSENRAAGHAASTVNVSSTPPVNSRNST